MDRALIKLFWMACIAMATTAHAGVAQAQDTADPLHATLQTSTTTPIKIQTRHITTVAANMASSSLSEEVESDRAGRTTLGAVLATLAFMGTIALRRNRSKGR